ncbi:hypothetical protein HPB52_017151 [Rhipicephalus sanguineus]|uniref:Uncharacterized protein n=1 Tax=Rhipicephalus sanguineus TaxID=34632 RepID=A0A9D4SR13_RHISA|nr:hypothetical protein HPB52_017151 [Rhipicephalus sanguineus]
MLLQALSNNKSIRRLSLERFSITEEEARVLVEMLQSSRTLCRFSFHPHNCQTSTSVILMLSPIISSNYMLIDMRTNWRQSYFGWYPIKDVMRRNNSLVTRAAHFVMGTRHKHCAAAAELMQFNPGLVRRFKNSLPLTKMKPCLELKTA